MWSQESPFAIDQSPGQEWKDENWSWPLKPHPRYCQEWESRTCLPIEEARNQDQDLCRQGP